MMVSLVYNSTGTKNKSKINLNFSSNCYLCIHESGFAKTFDNVNSLLHHVQQVHYQHPMAKRYKISLKRLQFVINFVSKKNGSDHND